MRSAPASLLCRQRAHRLPWRQLLCSGALLLAACGGLSAAAPANSSARNGTAVAQAEPAARWLLLDAARCGKALVAVGERGAILRSTDSGRSWTRCAAPEGETLTGVAFAPDGLQGWAVGHSARILSTTDGGVSWKTNYTHTGGEASLLDVACVSPGRIIAVGAFGLALESRDGGTGWSPLSLPSSDKHLNRITVSAGGQVFIAGESGLLLRSANGGDTWDTLPSPYEGSFYGIIPLASGDLLAHGLRGSLLLAHGATAPSPQALPAWERLPVAKPGLLAAALQTTRGQVIVAGQARLFLLSRDGGASFSPWNPGITTAVAELLEAPDGTLLAFGEDGVSVLPAP